MTVIHHCWWILVAWPAKKWMLPINIWIFYADNMLRKWWILVYIAACIMFSSYFLTLDIHSLKYFQSIYHSCCKVRAQFVTCKLGDWFSAGACTEQNIKIFISSESLRLGQLIGNIWKMKMVFESAPWTSNFLYSDTTLLLPCSHDAASTWPAVCEQNYSSPIQILHLWNLNGVK